MEILFVLRAFRVYSVTFACELLLSLLLWLDLLLLRTWL